VAMQAQAAKAFRSGKGRYVQGFNHLDYRKHRILSRIFFAVEKHGVLPGSFGYPEFHFEYQGTIVGASPGPMERNSRGFDAKLKFVVLDPNPSVSVAYAEWSDGDSRLENTIPEITSSILAATRAAARARREQLKPLLEAALLRILDGIKQLEEPAADGFGARCDPRTFQTLLDLAERHCTAALVRRFLRALSKEIADGSVVVADRSLDDWTTWGAAKTDEFDPLVQGPEYVFEKLVKS
jgi:hypothetical protein